MILESQTGKIKDNVRETSMRREVQKKRQDSQMGNLYRQLCEYSESDYYGFHMPGHKRNGCMMDEKLPCRIDITEIEGFDDLHHASGILKEAQESAARVYGADETYFLVNGSTVGILSAILGNTKKGDTVLVARNCHKSVYHAIFINELKPVYLYPEFSGELQLNTEISVSAVKTALKEHSDIRAVILVSPTYDGVISDVGQIADAVHEYGIPLIVDQAHGAHLGFHSYFGENANRQGADVVIHSLHKTLPSLTQTALLHMNGPYANRRKVRRYLDMLQSSSPSYVLMASIDGCIRMLEEGEALFEPYVGRLQKFWEKTEELNRLRVIRTEHFDPSKIVISVKDADITSRELYETLLDRYRLQMEMVSGTYVLAMTSVGDTEEGFDRLWAALKELDQECNTRMAEAESQTDSEGKIRILEQASQAQKDPKRGVLGRIAPVEQVFTSAEMERILEDAWEGDMPFDSDRVLQLRWEESAGYISTEYAYLYPPGIPILVPGERISKEAVDTMLHYRELDFHIEGLQKEDYIKVWADG